MPGCEWLLIGGMEIEPDKDTFGEYVSLATMDTGAVRVSATSRKGKSGEIGIGQAHVYHVEKA